MHSLGPIGSAAGFLIACDAPTAFGPLAFFAVGRARCISRSAAEMRGTFFGARTRRGDTLLADWFTLVLKNWRAIRRTKRNVVGCVYGFNRFFQNKRCMFLDTENNYDFIIDHCDGCINSCLITAKASKNKCLLQIRNQIFFFN
jgi:hypothetical protein